MDNYDVLLWQYIDYQHSHSKHSYKYQTEMYCKHKDCVV